MWIYYLEVNELYCDTTLLAYRSVLGLGYGFRYWFFVRVIITVWVRIFRIVKITTVKDTK